MGYHINVNQITMHIMVNVYKPAPHILFRVKQIIIAPILHNNFQK